MSDFDWIVLENEFDSNNLGKYEAIMCQGNGYMGIRAAVEERYVSEKRDFFISGTFNKFDEAEVTELPNCPDFFGTEINVSGKPLDLNKGIVTEYQRKLNLKNGEIVRSFIWNTEETGKIRFQFRRFISMKNLHLAAQVIEIEPIDKNLSISINSGIDGQVTNSGVQHFSEVSKRMYANEIIQMIQKTTESGIDFVFNLKSIATINVDFSSVKKTIAMDRRRIWNGIEKELNIYETLKISKYFNVYTSRDLEFNEKNIELDDIKSMSVESLEKETLKGYESLLAENSELWETKIWKKAPIKIESINPMDQLALRFIQYHLAAMTPTHDNRMSIGAKGLSGEGYKGHAFWDTEIFMLPYYTWTFPNISRKLLEYRYLCLDGAKRKAKDNGYEGAMFPWESAWIDDGETTPVWGAADILTGEPTKIWSGFIEQHITSDIVFAIWQYYQTTNDEEFMKTYGYEIIFEASKFWISRLEWNEKTYKYEIKEVIGPDEYKEHVNNNSFTNYTAHWTIKKAIELSENTKIKLNGEYDLKMWKDRIDKIELPHPTEEGILPQDDSYLSKEIIDLNKYKNQRHVGSIFKDYNLSQVNKIQVSKQADVLLLMYLFEELFSKEVIRNSWEYYEPKTLHDSSLSLSTHCVLASDMGNRELAYELFRKSADIDLGPNMKSSDHGIHAAAMGGLWQCTINGFGGIRNYHGALRIEPKLPKEWSLLEFKITFQGTELSISIDKEETRIKRLSNTNNVINVLSNGNEYVFGESLILRN